MRSLWRLLVSTGALAMDSNIHIAFPLGTNQVTSDDVRIVQSPPTQVEARAASSGLRFGVNIKGYVGVEFIGKAGPVQKERGKALSRAGSACRSNRSALAGAQGA